MYRCFPSFRIIDGLAELSLGYSVAKHLQQRGLPLPVAATNEVALEFGVGVVTGLCFGKAYSF